MSLDALPLTDAQQRALRERGIVDAEQLQGMLASAAVRPALAGLLGLSVDGLAPLDAALAAEGLDPHTLAPFERPPSGVYHPDDALVMDATETEE